MSQLRIPATIRAAGATGAAPRSRRGLRRLLLSCAMLSFAAGPARR